MAIDIRGATPTAEVRKTRKETGRGKSYDLHVQPFLCNDGEVVGELMDARGVEFTMQEEAGKPPYLHAKIGGTGTVGVDVHLRDGLTPDADGRIIGRMEVKYRQVWAPDLGPEFKRYHAINVFPSETQGAARVRIVAGNGDWGTDQNGFGVKVIRPRAE